MPGFGYIPVGKDKKYKEPGPKTKFFFGRIFPLIFVAVGFGLFWKGTSDMELAKQSESWPIAEGKIISSEITRKTSSSSNGGSSTTYHAEVSYQYTAEGRSYTSDRVSFGQYGSSDRDHAQDIVNRYQSGETVQVFYKFDDPSVAVLEPGIGFGVWIFTIVGVIFSVLGVVMFWKLPTAMNKKIPA